MAIMGGSGAAGWLAAGACTAAVDGIMLWRRYTGRLGGRVRAECRAVFLRNPANAVAVVLFRDFLLPPAGMAVCAVRYLRDREGAR